MPVKTSPLIYDVTLGSVTDFGNETRQFELLYPPGTSMNFIPGQFVAVLCPSNGKVVRRAYSVASPPERPNGLELVIKLVEGGLVTNWFWSLKPGDRFQVHGPYGKFILPDEIDFEPVFVATGTGIAPFRSMTHHLLSHGFTKPIRLIFGSRYDTMIPYHDEFLKLAAAYPNFSYIPTISRPGPAWKGETGYVQTKLDKIGSPEGKRIYICGLNEMIQSVQETAFKLGFPKDRVSYEKYD